MSAAAVPTTYHRLVAIKRRLPEWLLFRLDPYNTSADRFVRDAAAAAAPSARVLDAGAGDCRHAPSFAHAHYFGTDHALGDAVAYDYGRLAFVSDVTRLPLREASVDLPVVILTARDSVRDRVAGLESGADDYIPKPFAFDELLARVRLRLRADRVPEATILRAGELGLDLRTRRAQVGQSVVDLTTREFALAEVFFRHPDQVLSREQLPEAELELGLLEALDMPRLVADLFRRRIEGLREELARRQRRVLVEQRLRAEVDAESFREARESLLELESLEAVPARLLELRRLVDDREESARRRAAIAEGVQALRSFLAAGQIDQAELALRVLQRMAPNDPTTAALGAELRARRQP